MLWTHKKVFSCPRTDCLSCAALWRTLNLIKSTHKLTSEKHAQPCVQTEPTQPLYVSSLSIFYDHWRNHTNITVWRRILCVYTVTFAGTVYTHSEMHAHVGLLTCKHWHIFRECLKKDAASETVPAEQSQQYLTTSRQTDCHSRQHLSFSSTELVSRHLFVK